MCVYFILWWCYFKFYSNCTGMFYITCPLQQLSLMYDLCYPVDVWTMHLHRVREEEEGDGWKGVDDTSGVGVCTRAEKRKALTKKLNLVHAENVVYAHDHKRITKTAFLTTLLFFSFLKSQVAARNKNQRGSRATAGRGSLLCPMWQETEAVPRCNEGTAALQCCSLSYIHDTEANALKHANEQLCL